MDSRCGLLRGLLRSKARPLVIAVALGVTRVFEIGLRLTGTNRRPALPCGENTSAPPATRVAHATQGRRATGRPYTRRARSSAGP